MPNFIKTEIEGNIAWLILNRPEILNAWHRGMREEVVDAIDRFDRDPAIGAVVITGAGEAAVDTTPAERQ